VKCIHTIKCAKVRALFAENKVRFARAEQLWCQLSKSGDHNVS